MAAVKEKEVEIQDELADSLNDLFTSVSTMVKGELQVSISRPKILKSFSSPPFASKLIMFELNILIIHAFRGQII